MNRNAQHIAEKKDGLTPVKRSLILLLFCIFHFNLCHSQNQIHTRIDTFKVRILLFPEPKQRDQFALVKFGYVVCRSNLERNYFDIYFDPIIKSNIIKEDIFNWEINMQPILIAE